MANDSSVNLKPLMVSLDGRDVKWSWTLHI
jgi:hypothetical protein